MKEASGRHLGSIQEASGEHPGAIWEASGKHPGGIWEASGRHLGLQAAMGLQEAPNHKNRCPSQLKCNISIKQITKCVKSQRLSSAAAADGAAVEPRPLYQHRENPYR